MKKKSELYTPKLDETKCKSIVSENIDNVMEGRPLTAPLRLLKTSCDFMKVYNYVYYGGKSIAVAERSSYYNKEYQKAYRKTDRYKSYLKSYRKSDKYKSWRKAYCKTDKWKAYQKAYYQRKKAEKSHE